MSTDTHSTGSSAGGPSTAGPVAAATARLPGMRRARRWYGALSIRTRVLVVLIAMAVGPLLGAMLLAGHYGRSLLKDSIGGNLELVAHAVVNSIDQRVEQHRQTVTALSRYPLLQHAASAGADAFVKERADGDETAEQAWRQTDWSDNPVAQAHTSQVLRDARLAASDLAEIWLTDADGWLVAASGPAPRFRHSGETWWTRATGGGCDVFHIDELRYDWTAGQYASAVSVPVCLEDELVGVVRANVAFSVVLGQVADLNPEHNADIVLLDASGTVVARLGQPGPDDALLDVNALMESTSLSTDHGGGFLEAEVDGEPFVIGWSVSTGAGAFAGLGWTAMVVQPTARAYAPVVGFQRTMGVLSLALLVVAVLVGGRAASGVIRPIRHSAEVARAIAAGDLTGQVTSSGRDEFDLLAESLNGMTANLRRMVGSIRGAATDVESVTRSVVKNSGQVVSGSRDQIGQVEETQRLMREADRSLDGISLSMQEMVAAAERSSDSVTEMEHTITDLAQATETLSSSTDSTADDVREMVASIQQVDQGVENLRGLAEATAASVEQMDVAIQSVQKLASTTATVTAQNAEDAESGRVAVERTMTGMAQIEAAAARTTEMITGLTAQVGKIGSILEIIDDVTEQTNLLALNASILAAQAGDEGRGFAVVADEIKKLAERTARSTQEITDLIRSIETGTAEAGGAMMDGSRHVNQGVERAREAGEALVKILGGARESSEMVGDIVSSAGEHAAQSHHVAAAMARLHETVAEMRASTKTQATRCTSMLASSEQVRSMTERVRQSMVDQRERGGMITRSMQLITGMVKGVEQAAERQKGLSSEAVAAVSRIENLSSDNVAALAEVDDAIRQLAGRAEKLRDEIAVFRDRG